MIDQVQVSDSSRALGWVWTEGVWWPGMQAVNPRVHWRPQAFSLTCSESPGISRSGFWNLSGNCKAIMEKPENLRGWRHFKQKEPTQMCSRRDHRRRPRLVYPTKISITIDLYIKTFQEKAKFKKYLCTNPVWQKILPEKLQPKDIH